ncbi:MAG: Smr/MutS family protein [Myxococcota bacterium]
MVSRIKRDRARPGDSTAVFSNRPFERLANDMPERSEVPEFNSNPAVPNKPKAARCPTNASARADAKKQRPREKRLKPEQSEHRLREDRAALQRPREKRLKPEQSEHRLREDRAALQRLYADVTPLANRPSPKRIRAETELKQQRFRVEGRGRQRRLRASNRLDAFRFRVSFDEDGGVEAIRHDADPVALRGLSEEQSDTEIDLHGFTVREAEHALNAFLRRAHRSGTRVVRVIHGKGRHSYGGLGVLADLVVQTLTEGTLSAKVLAFTSAGRRQGGRGALNVRLTLRKQRS